MSRPRPLRGAILLVACSTMIALPTLAGASPAGTGRDRLEALLHRPALVAPAAADAGPGAGPAPPNASLTTHESGALDLSRIRPARVVAAYDGPPSAAPSARSAPPGLDGFFIPPRSIDVASAGDIDGNGTTDWIHGEAMFSPGFLTQAGRVTIYRRLPGSTPTIDIDGPSDYSYFGASVASAGDINGDGYDEVIVGAPGYDNMRGRAYIFRGTPGGITPSSPWVIEGVAGSDYLGYSVAGAGDVNGDGFDDVIIGSPGASSSPMFLQGRVSCYLGGPTGLSLTPAWTMEGSMSLEWAGFNIAGNGDVNADGYSDVLVASPYYSNGQANEGRVQLFLGGPGGLSLTNAFSYESNMADWGQEASCALPGDLNGDGYGDVVIGLPAADVGGTDDGEVLVYGGSPFTFFLPQIGSLFGGVSSMFYGYDVAPAGDLNGDGFADFLASAPFYGASSEGLWVENYGASNLAPLQNLFLVYSGPPGANAGISVAGGGDDGDGETDYLVGFNYYVEAGPATPDAVQGIIDPYMFVTRGVTLDELGFMPSRPFANGSFLETGYGISLAYADVNGDGYSDVIVGGNTYSDAFSSQGHADAYYGGAHAFIPLPFFAQKGLPELDGVGPPFEAPGWSYVGQGDNGNFGFSVARAGDVNGDGYDDVIIGAPTFTDGEDAEGAAFVFLGGPDGLSITPNWVNQGNEISAFYGYGVGAAGDINQDGYDDILVGAPLASPGGVIGAGQVSVYYGSPSGPAHVPARVLVGSGPDVHLGATCTGIGDVNGDGYPEVAVSEIDYGNPEASEGRILAYRGSATGLEALPFFDVEPDLAFAYAGTALAPAGDVNGDGYADLLVGAPGWTNGEADEGGLFLFTGSPLGLSSSPVSGIEGGIAGARLGTSAWTAGDLDKDGYGDVIVGLPGFPGPIPAPGSGTDGGGSGEGRAQIYFGTPAGLESLPRIEFSGTSTGTSGDLGQGLAGGGDVNGDGWPDVAFAAPYASAGKIYQDGVVSIALGNVVADGVSRPVRMLRSDNSTPIALGLRSDSPTSFRVAAQGRTPVGRGRTRLQWQAKAAGLPFDATGIGSSTALRTAVPVAGEGSSVPLNGLVNGLTTGERYHVRTRLATRHPYFHRTRWFTANANGILETDLRTAGPTGAVDAGDPAATPGGLAFAGAWPNPIAGTATLEYALPRAGRVTIDAYDATGRRVARVFDGEASAGPGAATWNGRDDAGRALPRGLYFLKLGFGGEERTAKAVIAR